MACALTQGYDYAAGCRSFQGGISQALFAPLSDLATITVSAAGLVTAMTMKIGKQFRVYNLKPELSFFTDNPTGSSENGTLTYAQSVSVTLLTMEQTYRQEIKLLGQNYLLIIVRDNNGVYRLAGYNGLINGVPQGGMELATGEAGGGTLRADGHKQTIVFNGSSDSPMQDVTGSLIATLTAPAV